ncbi:MAG: methionine gamma-lyase family protein [Ruminococcus sp.]|uniref:methionine gamma-lyase family protein n=1 Tax=Ruminococcus sp. TaxID=41978 RepID=UPI0028737EA0|nr:methionine gamma-lyase family protein [Ruminococcus sp.]MBQ3284940.1 methionine gamma-lyase family protein [Ruminococcus sp.]
MKNLFNIDEKILAAADKAMAMCKEHFEEIERVKEFQQQKMLKAFQEYNVSESMFAGSTGYGYDDRGRDTLDKIYAYVFDAEDALARQHFLSGTHTLTVALFGMLRPGDEMLCVTGTPYDTIQPVIGITPCNGSLRDFGVKYSEVALLPDGTVDLEGVKNSVSEKKPKMVYIQRSKGYALRPSLRNKEIKAICDIVKPLSPETIIMLDNCYGEFTEYESPITLGVDIMAGSMIKNAGGGIAPTGGYIAGRADLIELCAFRLTSPGTGRELGCTLGVLREMYLGAYHAPVATAEAIKTAVFASALFEVLGYDVEPSYQKKRGDIIDVITLGSPEKMCAFCRGIQSGSPIDSFVAPQPSPMPGYDSEVIMAAGAFTLGSSIEISADGPLREPYAVYLQGGISFATAKLSVMLAAQEVEKVQ